MMFVKPPYTKFMRFLIDSNSLWEQSKKYIFGWLPCYTCDHRLYAHVSYDHLSDWKGVCVSNHTLSGDSCGCEEFDFISYVKYFIPNMKSRLHHNRQVDE